MMRARSNPGALRAGVGLAVAGLALAFAGCGGTRACRDGTLFVTVDFVADAVSAQKVSIDVKPEGAPLRTEVFDHAPGATEGTIEVDFPGGYTSGNRVTLVLVGRKNGLPFAATTASVVLASGCSSTTVQLGGTPFDGGNGDAGGDAPTGAGGAGAGGSGGAGAGGSGGTGAGGKTDGGARRRGRGRRHRFRRRHHRVRVPVGRGLLQRHRRRLQRSHRLRRSGVQRLDDLRSGGGFDGVRARRLCRSLARLSGALRRRRVDNQRHAQARRRLHGLLV